MNLHEAFKAAVTDDVRTEVWKEAETALVRAGFCPSCACDGERRQLGPYQPPTRDTYGGRECYTCEGFVRTGAQDTGDATGELETDAAGCCYSDADPGL